MNATRTPTRFAPWAGAGAALDREVQRLPPADRDAFVLCTLAGAGPAEAARLLGVRQRTLEARLARARGLVAGALGRLGYALPAVLAALDLARAVRPRVPPRLALAAARAARTQRGLSRPVSAEGGRP